ncbi:beta-1,4-mannosyltransferase egh [Tachypleus tridentatus]|uniref:beta-1,4-mannosyltransferase egh n=1 Tax=Tachypleus tridentatus TaxID=6853 RepID=UPI003FD42A89
MILSSRTKHLLHCFLCFTVIITFEVFTGGIHLWTFEFDNIDPIQKYGYIGSSILYLLRILTLLALPQCVFNFLGLVVYNAFPDKVQLKGSPLLAPFICVRTVTRGDYPELVKNNVTRNMNTCFDVGMENFMIEVVSDKPVNLTKHPRIRELVVPSTYRSKSGALFKARALQYCLEDDVNILSDTDWIVHLDEETLLTENSLRGIMNFVFDGTHKFGQGLITYANENVVNWVTTLADCFRVADDMGKLRFQLHTYHRPLFGWKGSYVVTEAGAERKVSFDNGLDGSVAEDCFFAMMAYKEGYTFDFIQGEMWEKSPFSLWDFLQQRKRWMQGIFLVVHSQAIPLRNKIFLSLSLYSWITVPLSTSNLVLAGLYPIPCWQVLNVICAFVGAMNIYMYIFGVIKSFSLYRLGFFKFVFFVLGALCTIPFNIVIENIAVIWGCFGNKYRFYVVKKEVKPPVTV